MPCRWTVCLITSVIPVYLKTNKNPSQYNYHPNRRGRETHLRVVDFSSSCSCVFTKSEGKLIDISIIPLIAPAGTIQMINLIRKRCRNKETFIFFKLPAINPLRTFCWDGGCRTTPMGAFIPLILSRGTGDAIAIVKKKVDVNTKKWAFEEWKGRVENRKRQH